MKLVGRGLAGKGGRESSVPREDVAVLVRHAQDGEMAAFEALYRRSVGLVHAVCRRMTGDEALAEDLTQEVFVRAWQKLGSFRGDSAFGTWLTRLAVNVVITSHRRRRQWEGRVVLVEDLEPLAPAVAAGLPGQALDLERAIAGLPPGARAVFVLHDVHGLDHAAVAAATGTAVGTCKAQLHRARRLLREVLSQ